RTHPFQPWLHPLSLLERTKIAEFDKKFRVCGDGKFEAIIFGLVRRKIVWHKLEGKEFAVKLLPFRSRRLIAGIIKSDRGSSLSAVGIVKMNKYRNLYVETLVFAFREL